MATKATDTPGRDGYTLTSGARTPRWEQPVQDPLGVVGGIAMGVTLCDTGEAGPVRPYHLYPGPHKTGVPENYLFVQYVLEQGNGSVRFNEETYQKLRAVLAADAARLAEDPRHGENDALTLATFTETYGETVVEIDLQRPAIEVNTYWLWNRVHRGDADASHAIPLFTGLIPALLALLDADWEKTESGRAHFRNVRGAY
jgi:hypothetical protein